MESDEFPWLSSLPENEAHNFVLKLGSALHQGDYVYEDEEVERSWEDVLADVDKVIRTYRNLVLEVDDVTEGEPVPVLRYTLEERSQCKFVYNLEQAPESIANPNFPGLTVQPKTLLILLAPGEDGNWEAGLVSVSGPFFLKDDRPGRRVESVPFTNPMDEDSGAPEWVRLIVQDHLDTLNHEYSHRTTMQSRSLVAHSETIPEG
jgi:hypothetical protein